MEIRNYIAGSTLKMHLTGRLDALCSAQLDRQLKEAIAGGHQHIRLNLSDLQYLSSAGIQTLVRYQQQLAGVQGSLEIANPPEAVRKVLSLSGLEAVLAPEPEPGEARLSTLDLAGTRFEVAASSAEPAVQCQVVRAGRDSDRRQVSCSKNSLIIGTGALAGSSNLEDFGPVFAVGGAAICLPAGARENPDYMIAVEAFTPELILRSGIVCEGALTVRAGFGSELALGELAGAALEILGTDMGAVVMLGNTASGEPVMAAGLVIRAFDKILSGHMQPLTSGQWPIGVFTGAVFSGGPVAAFDADPAAAVAAFFQGRFESRVPQRIFTGLEASTARFAEGCLFAGSISGVTGESEH